MFGVYDYSFQWEEERISLGVEKKDEFLLYCRKTQEGSLEKIIGEKGGRLIINPVEPLNLPKEITPYLEFHFKPVVIQPDSKQIIFLKFPVEICVFLEANNNYNVLDIFSFSKPKYSLYGNPDDGMITRHIESLVYDRIPKMDPLVEGVMALTIQNTSRTWVEVTRVVFENISLNIFYGDIVAMDGRMEVFSQDIAETTTAKSPFMEDMKLAIPLFTARQILLPDKLTYLMEFGVGD